jgi:hypothetical protein
MGESGLVGAIEADLLSAGAAALRDWFERPGIVALSVVLVQ